MEEVETESLNGLTMARAYRPAGSQLPTAVDALPNLTKLYKYNTFTAPREFQLFSKNVLTINEVKLDYRRGCICVNISCV